MDAASINFSTLTPLQREALDAGGWHVGPSKRPAARVLQTLLNRGLLIKSPRRFMGVTIVEFDVPPHVQQAWEAHKATAS